MIKFLQKFKCLYIGENLNNASVGSACNKLSQKKSFKCDISSKAKTFYFLIFRIYYYYLLKSLSTHIYIHILKSNIIYICIKLPQLVVHVINNHTNSWNCDELSSLAI